MKLLLSKCQQNGFSLIEVLIAIVIFSLGILAVGAMQITSIKGNSQSVLAFDAANVATGFMDSLLILDYEDPVLIDDDDGKDDTDADADTDLGDDENSLNDLTNPDGAMDRDGDGNNDIFWNIAPNYPRDGVRTIRVIVNWTDRGGEKSLSMTNIKAEE